MPPVIFLVCTDTISGAYAPRAGTISLPGSIRVIGCEEVALNKKLQLGNVMIDRNKRMEWKYKKWLLPFQIICSFDFSLNQIMLAQSSLS